MKTSFFEYYKIVLDKVKFDRNLMMKEYRKAIKQLRETEVDDLNRWLTSQGNYPMLQTGLKDFHNDRTTGRMTLQCRQLQNTDMFVDTNYR